MEIDKSVYSIVQEEYYKKQIRARAEKERRRKLIYDKIPDFKEVDENMGQSGLMLAKIMLEGEKENSFESIKNRMNFSSQLKKGYLQKYGYPEDFIDDVYECRLCRDTGYVQGEMCGCMKMAVIRVAMSLSNISGSLSEVTFERFDTNYYPDETDENGNNPRRVIMNILKYAENFIENFGSSSLKNMLFYGAPGLGKTYLSAAIANELVKKGYTVLYYSAKELLGMITDNEFSRDYPRREECRRAYECDLLIIDDLGSEHITTAAVTSFFDILNTRMVNSKRMIINTNLDIKELNGIYSARIVSRLMEFEIFKFIGKDIRYEKNI